MVPAPLRSVSYLRVSTDGQGRSGLGLEAQRQAEAAYVAQAGGELVAEFQEVESGKRADRPQRTFDDPASGRATLHHAMRGFTPGCGQCRSRPSIWVKWASAAHP